MIPSRRHRSLVITLHAGGRGGDPLPPAQVVDCDLAAEALQNNSDLVFGGVTYVGQPPSLYGRKTWSARFVPRRPLLCLLLIGTHLLLSVSNSSLISGAHTTLRTLGFSYPYMCPIIADGLQTVGRDAGLLGAPRDLRDHPRDPLRHGLRAPRRSERCARRPNASRRRS